MLSVRELGALPRDESPHLPLDARNQFVLHRDEPSLTALHARQGFDHVLFAIAVLDHVAGRRIEEFVAGTQIEIESFERAILRIRGTVTDRDSYYNIDNAILGAPLVRAEQIEVLPGPPPGFDDLLD